MEEGRREDDPQRPRLDLVKSQNIKTAPQNAWAAARWGYDRGRGRGNGSGGRGGTGSRIFLKRSHTRLKGEDLHRPQVTSHAPARSLDAQLETAGALEAISVEVLLHEAVHCITIKTRNRGCVCLWWGAAGKDPARRATVISPSPHMSLHIMRFPVVSVVEHNGSLVSILVVARISAGRSPSQYLRAPPEP